MCVNWFHYLLAFAVLCDVVYSSSLSEPASSCAVLCGLCSELIPSQSNYYVCVITGVLSAWVDFSDLVHCVLVL